MFSARQGAVLLVQKVFAEGAYTNIVLNKMLKENAFSDVERRFLTELVYGTVRAAGTLDWYLGKFVKSSLTALDPLVLAILRVALYQLLYMEKVPVSAAVNEAVNLTKQLANRGAAGLVNGVLRNFLRRREQISLPQDESMRLALELWHPRYLVRKWLQEYGREATEQLCKFDNHPAPVTLRVNTLKITRENLLKKLQSLGVEAAPGRECSDAVFCGKIPALQQLLGACPGEFYLQDESSMLVGSLFAPEKGQRILDMCAAPGGKATHLAQLMNNQGEILACDIHPHKLPLITANARALGISIIKTRLLDGTKFCSDFSGKFDGVLVDAPCSGLGVLRRRAEARWRKKPGDLALLPTLQRQILENGARYVRQGGVLQYSTCTLERQENQGLVAGFLEDHPEFVLNKERQILPQREGMDGFYMARMMKV